VLHFTADADARASVAAFTGAAAPGSYLVLSHVTGDPEPRAAAVGTAAYGDTANPITLRTRDQILALFAGLQILEPGLVPVPRWRPDEPDPADPGKAWILGGVARKPA